MIYFYFLTRFLISFKRKPMAVEKITIGNDM